MGEREAYQIKKGRAHPGEEISMQGIILQEMK